jgi:glycosyltransferase involved in cell wall biosynthesis
MAEAIRRVADDPNWGREMGLQGRRYLEEHFDRSVIAGKLLSVMEDMTGSK